MRILSAARSRSERTDSIATAFLLSGAWLSRKSRGVNHRAMASVNQADKFMCLRNAPGFAAAASFGFGAVQDPLVAQFESLPATGAAAEHHALDTAPPYQASFFVGEFAAISGNQICGARNQGVDFVLLRFLRSSQLSISLESIYLVLRLTAFAVGEFEFRRNLCRKNYAGQGNALQNYLAILQQH